jgi:metal-dependent HD superfamily phosphatase/phosphodiesterase
MSELTQEEVFQEIASQLDETDNPETQFSTANRLVKIVKSLIQRHGCPHREVIIASALQAYEQYVRPIDLPGIPNTVEPMVDSAVRNVLENTLHWVGNTICNE